MGLILKAVSGLHYEDKLVVKKSRLRSEHYGPRASSMERNSADRIPNG